MTKSTKYALLKYNTDNIGDEIQSLAAKRFLPQVDYYLDRDNLNSFVPVSDNEDIKLIMNGWYSHKPQNFPMKQGSIISVVGKTTVEIMEPF